MNKIVKRLIKKTKVYNTSIRIPATIKQVLDIDDKDTEVEWYLNGTSVVLKFVKIKKENSGSVRLSFS